MFIEAFYIKIVLFIRMSSFCHCFMYLGVLARIQRIVKFSKEVDGEVTHLNNLPVLIKN